MSGSKRGSSGSSGKVAAGKDGGKPAGGSGKPRKKTTQEIVPIYARLPQGTAQHRRVGGAPATSASASTGG